MFNLNQVMKDHVYPALDAAEDSKDTGRLLARILSCMFNSFGTKTLAETCAKDTIIDTHRTVQQQIMLGIIYYLKAMSECQYFDDRNKAAVEAAQIAYKALEDANMTYLPMI